jgi:hypothetical protein
LQEMQCEQPFNLFSSPLAGTPQQGSLQAMTRAGGPASLAPHEAVRGLDASNRIAAIAAQIDLMKPIPVALMGPSYRLAGGSGTTNSR